jgi:hypothetical protein
VIVTTVTPAPIIVPATGFWLMVIFAGIEQLSVAVAAIRGTIAWQLAFAFNTGGAGNVITGLVLSVTVTLNVHARLVLPVASVAV